jgi:hypothetical protein
MQERSFYNILLVATFASAILIFFLLYKIIAPYGRHIRRGWGLTIQARFGWLIMEFPAVLAVLVCFVIGNRRNNIVSVVFLSIWMIHYVHRTFIYPFLMRSGRKQFPVLLMTFAILFNTINGYLNGRYLFYFAPIYRLSWLADPRFIIGTTIFLTGFITNIYSDWELRRLRKPGEDVYRMPRRGLFRFVSSPNYLGEIIEWTGWAITTWSLPGVAFAFFTIANLMPRAYFNHRWYQKEFSNYPAERKALIPFIY